MPLLLAIAVGGALGSLGRYGVAEAMIGLPVGPWPWPTLVVNVLGAFVIGLIASSARVKHGPSWLPAFLITGVLGGFTTVSALALQTGLLIDDGSALSGILYFAATVLLGLVAVRVAVLLTSRRTA